MGGSRGELSVLRPSEGYGSTCRSNFIISYNSLSL